MATVEHVDRTLGSAAATELLYRRHGSRVLRYCLRCLRRPADAEDAVQQTFLQAHRALGRGIEPVAEATWLLTIARNVCLTRADAVRRRARVEFAEDPSVLAEIVGAEDTAPELSVELVGALARLPERQRLVLFLREWQELSYAEIAVALETTESAVETLLFRARKSLAVQLGGQKRRRRAFDLAWLLGWGRSVSGVALPKLATGVAAVVAVAAAGVATSDSAPRQAHHSPVAAAPVHVQALPQARAPMRPHKQAAPIARTVVPAPKVVDAAPASDPGSSVVSAAPSATDAPATLPLSVPATVIPATPLDPVVAPVVVAVPVVGPTVDQAVQDVADTAQAAAATVTTALTPLLPGH